LNLLAGIDIGGTKCAVSLGREAHGQVKILAHTKFPTLGTPQEIIAKIIELLSAQLRLHGGESVSSIGISCGGPLSSELGRIWSPPNLPGWYDIDIVSPMREAFRAPAYLQNDANACALAEWRWGAGRGKRNLVFLTFGTGMGAGLILDGRLYSGTNDMAGEIGHIRMEPFGPIGYGKPGSFEGFCSGGGIAELAKTMAANRLECGEIPLFCENIELLSEITAQKVGGAAVLGDPLALEVFEIVGAQLGRGLAILVDILNPELIVIGSIYGRQQSLLEPIVIREVEKEALPLSRSVCRIVPAELGEQIGDYASLAVALYMGNET